MKRVLFMIVLTVVCLSTSGCNKKTSQNEAYNQEEKINGNVSVSSQSDSTSRKNRLVKKEVLNLYYDEIVKKETTVYEYDDKGELIRATTDIDGEKYFVEEFENGLSVRWKRFFQDPGEYESVYWEGLEVFSKYIDLETNEVSVFKCEYTYANNQSACRYYTNDELTGFDVTIYDDMGRVVDFSQYSYGKLYDRNVYSYTEEGLIATREEYYDEDGTPLLYRYEYDSEGRIHREVLMMPGGKDEYRFTEYIYGGQQLIRMNHVNCETKDILSETWYETDSEGEYKIIREFYREDRGNVRETISYYTN